MGWDHYAFCIHFKRMDDKLVLYLLFPLRPVRLPRFGWRERWRLRGFLCVFVDFWFGNFENRKSITI